MRAMRNCEQVDTTSEHHEQVCEIRQGCVRLWGSVCAPLALCTLPSAKKLVVSLLSNRRMLILPMNQ